MTRRIIKSSESASQYDGIVDEIEGEFDFDGGEIIRPANTVIIVTPDGFGEAVSSDRQLDKDKAERKAIRDAKKKDAEEKKVIVKKSSKKKTNKPKE